MLTGSEIRRKFLDYFAQHGHKDVHSSSLVPANDPTLLFTNAGMNQFKDVFLGLEKRDYNRATTSQKCVRAGGKHNDLENVGFTNRHHTFFEMLGNFSFGDYFKKDAIAYAWELITSEKWFGIPKNKLYVTIFNGEGGLQRDVEAYDLWLAQGVSKERIFESGLKDNFWQMGDTGPCGPSSEIHYDMGPAGSDAGHTDCKFPCDCGRYVEIWNLVFMQFDRDVMGKLNPLPKPSIDTGMGLERLAAVLQGVISNYDTDLFVPLIKRAAELTGTSTNNGETGVPARPVEQSSTASDLQKSSGAQLRRMGEGARPHTIPVHHSAASLRVIADHSRAATFLISDGVLPSNEGRGYVLRKIIRRAITHGRLLGQTKPFLNKMVFAVRDLMQGAYPELSASANQVSEVVHSEERSFARTLTPGLKMLDEAIEGIRGRSAVSRPPNLERLHGHLRTVSALARQAAQQASGSPVLLLGRRVLQGFQHQMAGIGDYVFAEAEQLINQPQESMQRMAKTLQTVNDDFRRVFDAPTKQPSSQFEEAFDSLSAEWGAAADAAGIDQFPGKEAFKLYDTFGVPPDFVEDATRDQGLIFDWLGFDRAMAEQRDRARASWKGAAKQAANPAYQQLPKSEFVGYHDVRANSCEVLAIIKNGQGAQELKSGEEGEVILDHTPFYAESGGQVGDRGWLYSEDHNTIIAEVKGCYYPVQGVRAHQVVMKSPPNENRVGWATRALRVGDKVNAAVNTEIRQSTMRNHTATHLLQAGLREVLGKHVKQAGSLVAPNHLRFDFSHFTSVADEELQDIEDLINKEVLRNQKVEVIPDVPIDIAINEYKAMALFGEKYGDRVRVIKIGDFSTELCGGTHTDATGEIGLIKVLKEGSVSSGIRRIEAVTGEGSLHHFQQDHQLENVVASFVGPTSSQKTRTDGAPSTGEALSSPAEALRLELEKKDSEIKRLQRELDQARMKSASSTVALAGEHVKEVRGVKVLAHRVDNLERQQMRTLVDQLRDKLGSGVVILGSATNGNVALIVSVTKDLTSKLQAGKIIGPVAEKVGGRGGGRPDMAEAGGKNPEGLGLALSESYKVVEALLGN